MAHPDSAHATAFEVLLERGRPDLLGLRDRDVDRRLALRRQSRDAMPPVVPITRAGTPAAAGARRAAPRSFGRTDRHDDARRRLAEERCATAVAACSTRRSTRRADAAGVEAALGERHRDAAVGAVVGRAQQSAGRERRRPASAARASRARSSAGGSPRTRPCTTFRYSLPPSSPRSSPSRTIASPPPWNARVEHARRVLEQRRPRR